MNICIFGNSFLPAIGGKEYVMHNLANALVAHGHDVTVVAKRVGWCRPVHERAYELKRYSLPIRGSGRCGFDELAAILTVVLINNRYEFDVLNCHGVDYAGTMARHLKSLCQLPLIMTPHGVDVQKVPEIGYGLRLDEAWEKRISKNLKAADYVTAISQSVHGDLDVVPEDRIVDISNGIHVERFAGPRGNYLREYCGIKSGSKIILSVGRNHIKKGYDYGIRAVSEIAKDFGYRNFHYVVIGRGVKEHKGLVAECNAGSYVTLIEELPTEKITLCYKSADIFFSPSIVEGLSLVSIEAMAAGLPLVVTNVPGNDDVVKENGCGLIVLNKDPSDMARGLYRLLTDDECRNDLAEVSIKSSGMYDWLQIAKEYEKVYQQAIINKKIQ